MVSKVEASAAVPEEASDEPFMLLGAWFVPPAPSENSFSILSRATMILSFTSRTFAGSFLWVALFILSWLQGNMKLAREIAYLASRRRAKNRENRNVISILQSLRICRTKVGWLVGWLSVVVFLWRRSPALGIILFAKHGLFQNLSRYV